MVTSISVCGNAVMFSKFLGFNCYTAIKYFTERFYVGVNMIISFNL